jgi:hypothetical protein
MSDKSGSLEERRGIIRRLLDAALAGLNLKKTKTADWYTVSAP